MPSRGYRKGLSDHLHPLAQFVRTRLTHDEHAQLAHEATVRNVTMAKLARLVLEAHLRQQPARLPQPRAEQSAILREIIRLGNNLNQLTRQANTGLVPISKQELQATLDALNALARRT